MENKKRRVLICKNIPKRCFQIFEHMRKANELCDVTFQVGNELISAHRVILAAVIPSFRYIASEDISIPEIKPSAFKCLIEFAYTCELKIEKENVTDLLTAACCLCIDEVRQACCDFIAEHLEPTNVLDIRDIAQKINCTELMNDIDSYVEENFGKISENNEFLKCSFLYLKDIIGRNNLDVENEEHVLEAVIRWAKGDPEDRKSKLPQLLTKVRMCQIQPKYFVQLLEKEELIRTSLECRDLIDEAKNRYLDPDMEKRICSFSTEPRQPKSDYNFRETGNESIYKFHHTTEYTVQQFDVVEKKWLTKKTAAYFTVSDGITKLNNKMYHFHWGYTFEYDPAKDSYAYLNDMPTARIKTAAASLNGKVYIFGGRVGSYGKENWTACNAVECFDPENNEWKEMTPMSSGRWGLNAVALGTYIFVLGGQDKSSSFDYVDRYDPAMNKWRRMASMLTKRHNAGVVAYNGNIYASGGKTLSEETECVVAAAEVYNPFKNSWTSISPMSTARCCFTLLSCSGKLYALGGEERNKICLHTFDIYDPQIDTWKAGSSSDAKHYTSGAVVLAY